ncbi:MAG: hypothetical protein ACRD38_10485, partial [Nitrososphaerales archaeon]
MDNTYSPKLRWSRISYVVLSVILAATILASFSEHYAYAGSPYYWAESTPERFQVPLLMLVVVGGLGFMIAIARRSLSVTS